MVDPDLRLGSLYWNVWNGDPSTLGLAFRHPAARRVWSSLFGPQANPTGKPSVQNIRNDDLRWLQDSFEGGEGQLVLRSGDSLGETKYYASTGIDMSQPSQFSLAKQMLQQGSTGVGPTTVEGSTWTDVTGTSSVSGTDRTLTNVGDVVKKAISGLSAGFYQADFYAFLDPVQTLEANTWTVAQGSAPVSGTDRTLKQGSVVRINRTPLTTGTVSVSFVLTLDPGDLGWAQGTVQILVRNQADTKTIASEQKTIVADTGVAAPVSIKVSFIAQNVGYWYRIDTKQISQGATLTFDRADVFYHDTKTLQWQLYNDTTATLVASGNVSLGSATTQKVASVQWNANGTATYSVRVKRQAGTSRGMWVDKAVYQSVAINNPWALELGQNHRMWLFDYGASVSPTAYVWSPQNQNWTGVGTLTGNNGAKPIALAHSDRYEYVLLDNGKVYQLALPSTVTQYTAAFSNAVGIATGANRLWVLTEDTNGTRLWMVDLDGGTAPIAVPANPKYTVGQGTGYTSPKAQVTPDQEHLRRMANLQNGVAFVVNHGPTCVLYSYDAGADSGSPVTDFPVGFQARAMVHNLGLSYIGGGFPAVDTDGVTRNRPAVFIVDHSSLQAPIQLDVKLHRDTDPGSRVQDMQLYGPDLWVLSQVNSSPRKGRLWRISLTSPGGTFLYQEITTDDSQQSVNARALAVNWRNKIMCWGSGNPYVEQDQYMTSGDSYLESSNFDFGLTEQKLLLEFAVNGTIPSACSVEVWYKADDGAWTAAGTLTAPGTLPISTVDDSIRLSRLSWRAYLHSTDPTQTPVVQSLGPRAYLVEYARSWEYLLHCVDDLAGYHMDGQQVSGAVKAANLFSLADQGSLVELEDFFSSARNEDSQVYRVVVTDPEQVFLSRGESVIQVSLVER